MGEQRGFEGISLPFRLAKPRNAGMTMVLDKCLGPAWTQDWLANAADFVDVVKLGWGTARVLPKATLLQKLGMYRKADVQVCPGGTFFELAYAQRKVDYFFGEARDMGFSCVEVSDGTLNIPHEDKLACIRKGRALGLTVYSEVGKKSDIEDQRLKIDERVELALAELEAGACKVITEARESGSFGIFDSRGEVIPEYVEKLVSKVGLQSIVFEAPLSAQQQWLILELGNAVNLGNIPPEGVLNLETLRLGLRSGTFKEFHLKPVAVHIENGVSGALDAANRDDVVVVVDALRCSTTIVTALAHGMHSIRPVTSAEECKGEVTAGERGGEKIHGLDYDNSPTTFLHDDFRGKRLVLTSTNGTECIRAASVGKSPVLIGSLVNSRAVATTALELAKAGGRNITILMAGRNNRLAAEDLISASEIYAHMKDCPLKGSLGPVLSNDFAGDFLASESGQNLVSLGKRDDVLFCARKDIYDVVPEFDGELVVARRLAARDSKGP